MLCCQHVCIVYAVDAMEKTLKHIANYRTDIFNTDEGEAAKKVGHLCRVFCLHMWRLGVTQVILFFPAW